MTKHQQLRYSLVQQEMDALRNHPLVQPIPTPPKDQIDYANCDLCIYGHIEQAGIDSEELKTTIGVNPLISLGEIIWIESTDYQIAQYVFGEEVAFPQQEIERIVKMHYA